MTRLRRIVIPRVLQNVSSVAGWSGNSFPKPVPLRIGSWLAELSPTIVEGANNIATARRGGRYSVQTYLHIKEGGIAGCPAGTYRGHHPLEHGLVLLTLGAEN